MRKKENGKKKKRIFLKIILCLLALIILFILIKLGINYIHSIKDKKITNSINELSKDDVVFVEINPSLALLINDNIIKEVACLNDDCISIYDKLNINNLEINEGISNIINVSKENGFNVSNGVSIKSTSPIEIKENKDVKIEFQYIDSSTKNKLLQQVINNKEEFYNNEKDDILKILEKDMDYGNLYTCKKNNEDINCYFKKDIFEIDESLSLSKIIKIAIGRTSDIVRVLNKFNIKAKIDNPPLETYFSLYINDYKFDCALDGICNSSPHRFEDNTKIYNCSEWGLLELYEGLAGLDLLHPTESLSHLLYEEEYSGTYDFYSKKEYDIRINKVCDINFNNCKPYKYQNCDVSVGTNGENIYSCKKIDESKYDYYYKEYYETTRNIGCLELESFGLTNELLCTKNEGSIYDLNSDKVVEYMRCTGSYENLSDKVCKTFNYTEADYNNLSLTNISEDGYVHKMDSNDNFIKCKLNKDTLKFACVPEYGE